MTDPDLFRALGAYLEGKGELEATAQTLFHVWRDQGWGPWLEEASLSPAQRVRGQALMARFEHLMRGYRGGTA